MSGEERPKPTAQPVGHQLRRAREALGLDISAIADQQHLRVSIIQAIEKGDYSKIDTELFLKGYVRAYAKQVGLDGDAIIRDLDIELEPRRKERERQLEADPLVDIERRKRRKRRLAKSVVALVILGALAVGISTYMAENNQALPFGDQADVAAPEEERDNGDGQPEPLPEADDAPDERTAQPESEPLNEPSDELPVGGAEDEPVEALAGQPDTQAESSAVVDEPQPVDVENLEPVAEDTTVAEPDEPPVIDPQPVKESAQPAADENVPASTGAELVMTFNDDCWVQVTDAEGNRLASTLQTNGDELRLEGVAPMNVIIGAMSAVDSIRFQGETVELDNIRTVNNRAQFTLEP
ncbi:cytoskeleton protein RodZ [Marinobacter persicus]|uniref:Cytoskeleton protein RodZ n=1 Tax=Marinobacter persicus TaxID=930118 RepID=A0A1I3WV86_9GAMM|nr:RodZ domain-containing protein [Marinobacter persicus]GHD47741.1 transcriptional regulator [Marinobacter persicus]SFK11173.1 cytoskeleton protein RodZ [Marinobacter persicus]